MSNLDSSRLVFGLLDLKDLSGQAVKFLAMDALYQLQSKCVLCCRYSKCNNMWEFKR